MRAVHAPSPSYAAPGSPNGCSKVQRGSVAAGAVGGISHDLLTSFEGSYDGPASAD